MLINRMATLFNYLLFHYLILFCLIWFNNFILLSILFIVCHFIFNAWLICVFLQVTLQKQTNVITPFFFCLVLVVLFSFFNANYLVNMFTTGLKLTHLNYDPQDSHIYAQGTHRWHQWNINWMTKLHHICILGSERVERKIDIFKLNLHNCLKF